MKVSVLKKKNKTIKPIIELPCGKSCRKNFNKLIPKKSKNTFIDYMNKNSNAITIMLAVLTPVFGALITFMLYSYYHGYFDYFSISEVWLDLSNTNNIFYPVFMIVVGLAFLIFNAIPIILIKYVPKKGWLISLALGILSFGILFTIIKSVTLNSNDVILYQSFTIWFAIYGIGLIIGFMDIGSDYLINKGVLLIKERKLANAIGTVIIIISLIAEVLICYSTGNITAQSKKIFKIVEYNKKCNVVLYETSDKFILAKATISINDDGAKYLTIHTSEQIIIDNTELNYNIIQFNTKPNIE